MDQSSASAALEVFINQFNGLVSDHNQILEENDELKAALEHTDEIISNAESLKQELAIAQGNVKKLTEGANKTTTIATAQAVELAKLREQVSMQQAEINRYKAMGIDRLKSQNQRLSESNNELTSKNNRLTHEKATVESSLRKLQKSYNELEEETIRIGRELSRNQGTGIYHQDGHHLVVWPQKLKVQDPNGDEFDCTALLYLHRSGRGGLITYSHEKGAQLCSAPVGGLKPSAGTIEYAKNWLYKVNVLQNGEPSHSDMMAVDYNTVGATA